jgi:hypothetical protein
MRIPMQATKWKAGDWVIYRKQKSGLSPGPRAQAVTPAHKGDSYHYIVEKYWTVERVLADGRLSLRTRRGKVHVVEANDWRLRSPRWWERLLFGRRFPRIEAGGVSK